MKLENKLFEAYANCSEHYMIYLCDMKINVSRWSKYAVDYFGLPQEYITDLPSLWVPKIHPEDRHIFTQDINEVFSGKKERHSCEYRVTTATGDYVWVHCTGQMVRDEDGKQDVFAGTIAHFGTDTKYDSGTNLLSLSAFRRDLNKFADQMDFQYGLLMIGVDDFKRINDDFGFSFGNAVLKRIATVITAVKSAGMKIYRLDGDKFVVLYPRADQKDLHDFWERLNSILTRQLEVENQTIYLTFSTGALVVKEVHRDEDTVFSDLEYALETAKKNRKGKVVFFSEELYEEKKRNQKILETILRDIRNGFRGFTVYYQPQIGAEDKRLFGAEALLRYTNEELGGNIPPGVFIPLLEKANQMLSIGKWVLTQALEQMSAWEEGGIRHYISVNVSYLQFRAPEFKQYVVDELKRLHYPPEMLILELTESCSIEDISELADTLQFLEEHGVLTSLDDFGSGYASLGVLRTLPVDWVKLDYSFVSRLNESERDRSIIRHIINLCRDNEINVCIEGIETPETEKLVMSYHPQLLQGYYYARPMPAEKYYKSFLIPDRQGVEKRVCLNEIRENQRSALETERRIVECVERIIGTQDMESTIDMVLETILDYYHGERSYIFEFDWKKRTSTNTYERCAVGIRPEIQNLQDVPLEANWRWIEVFREHKNIWIADLEELKDANPSEYEILAPQGIHSLIVVPFFENNVLQGYMGVDNPDRHKNSSYFLTHLTYFISSEISKFQLTRRLEILSYMDSLTGLQNRNSYTQYVSEYHKTPRGSVGVMFLDLNGLKKINDTFGHGYGDQYIKMLADLLLERFDKKEIYRISGDEFLVICEGKSEEEFHCLAEKLQQDIQYEDSPLATCGVQWQGGDCEIGDLVTKADQDMYQQKRTYYRRREDKGHDSKASVKADKNIQMDQNMLLEVLPVGIVLYDCDSDGVHLVFTNRFFRKMVGGYSSKWEENIDMLVVIHPQDRKRLQNEVIRASITGNVLKSRFRMKGTDGEYLSVMMSAQQIDKSGVASRFYATFMQC